MADDGNERVGLDTEVDAAQGIDLGAGEPVGGTAKHDRQRADGAGVGLCLGARSCEGSVEAPKGGVGDAPADEHGEHEEDELGEGHGDPPVLNHPVDGHVTRVGDLVEAEAAGQLARSLGADVDLLERELSSLHEDGEHGERAGRRRQPHHGDGEERGLDAAPAPSIGEADGQPDEGDEQVVELEGEPAQEEGHLA